MTRMQRFLGPTGMRAFFFLLAGTGLFSLILNAFVNQYDWVRPVQSLLLIGFLFGGALILISRVDASERLHWFILVSPAFGALVLGVFFLPQLLPPLAGAAIGWVVVGLFIFRPKTRLEYRDAIKHLHKSEYAEAVKIMDGLIKAEPQEENHYRFRAEVLRVWGKLDRAVRDYRKMTEIAPTSAVAFNGLAEVYLQSGDFQRAGDAARRAYELAPDEWVTLYNLGMIEDRLQNWPEVIKYLRVANEKKISDARHRFLIHLYLLRAYAHLGEMTAAQESLKAMKKQQSGLEEWLSIFKSSQADTLRAVLGYDVKEAQALLDGSLTPESMVSGEAL